MRIKNKLHYILKYLVLAFPLLLILGLIFATQTNYYDMFHSFYQNCVTFFFGGGFIGESYFNALFQTGLLAVDIDSTEPILSILLFYPLWIFYVYLFDMLVDILTFLPRFFHDLIHKD